MFWDVFLSLCAEIGADPTPTAVKIGFSNATATHWKNGQTPRGASLKKVADYFGVSPDYLLGKTDKKNKPTSALGDGLSDDRRYLIEAVQAMSDENVQKLRIIVEQVIAERGK